MAAVAMQIEAIFLEAAAKKSRTSKAFPFEYFMMKRGLALNARDYRSLLKDSLEQYALQLRFYCDATFGGDVGYSNG